ncbi:MAG: hypothetical protein EXX96DRAFT_533655 [Benjaminiella poitrasii]|nr:MAG: hypothetical protein EXX96DRAFT_533655 [Benjaminiella poitrasii]
MITKCSIPFFYDGIDEIRNKDNVIVNNPIEEIHTNITNPRIILETITSHKQYQQNKPAEKLPEPKEDPPFEPEKNKKNRADPNADYSVTTRMTFINRILEQPGGARNAKLIGGNQGIHEKTAQR